MEILTVKCGKETLFLSYENILYLESDGRYTTIYTSTNKYMVCRNIGLFEAELPCPPFARIHHTYIVNMQKVTAMGPYAITLCNNNTLPLARRRVTVIKELISTLMSVPKSKAMEVVSLVTLNMPIVTYLIPIIT